MSDSGDMSNGDGSELPRYPSPGDGDGGPQPGVVPLRPLRLAEITEGAVATMCRYARVVFPASAVIAVVGVVLVFLTEVYGLPVRRGWQTPVNELLASFAGVLVTLLTHALVVGVLTVVVGRAVLGEPITFGEAWAELRPRLLPLFGLTVVVTVITTVGLMLLVLPGIAAYVFLSLAVPALMQERGTVAEGLKRSVNLVGGSWWRVSGLLVVALLITLLVSLVVQLLFAQLLPLGAGTTPLADDTLTGHRLILGIGSVVAQTVAVPFSAAVTALIYLDQRMRRENLGSELRRTAGLSG
ncbi:hypothetical protein GCM10009676_34750 [Prauserella halophila]|uniref:DUF7847 domain-containing protein n=1 Tax=Prauserella halophila TaxID=185641 RepID=A0ABP4H3T7_9PSEU|nr:YciC family protein [Prauserella halophila]MCP2238411.1 Uncharacterized protein family (UPF0259) [Prauserella halophila]